MTIGVSLTEPEVVIDGRSPFVIFMAEELEGSKGFGQLLSGDCVDEENKARLCADVNTDNLVKAQPHNQLIQKSYQYNSLCLANGKRIYIN